MVFFAVLLSAVVDPIHGRLAAEGLVDETEGI